MTYARILATGAYLPEKILSNQELTHFLDTSDEWIKARSGITQRHIAAQDENTSDLAYYAAKDALERAEIPAKNIDMIIVATSTPDHTFPSVASALQNRLACRTIICFDIQAVCAGFIHALITAEQYIKTGMVENALVIGAETFSHILDWQDRSTAILFGDGAGAVLLQADKEPGILSRVLHTDGRYKELLYVPKGPGSASAIRDNLSPYLQMRGREVFKLAVKSLTSLVGELLQQADIQAKDLDFLIPHQANLRIIQSVAEHLDISLDKVIITIDQHANTSAASVPLALHQGITSRRIQRGDKLLLEAFGGGFVWGGSIIRY